ncbi:hypothetical protein HUK80_17615 [Flavobacterium sp. MAH-1]|uniref:Uncharacterized protein n=1 Tax=Flavobacterium agri TaxID=2743471 RepID=A0A7Y8Y6D2_9FLAO|nr:hypothetical protein [Flavobacterium agri]NUY82725.1 hypothetical protein [Flavobacterium agri]NYA72748.1 hypothetical protein [Flavobacterium agri]
MKIIVSGEFDENLTISLSQGTWNTTTYPLFEKLNSIDIELDREPNIYRLTIKYNAEKVYFENILYMSNPNLDELSFYFYKESERIFCKIKSERVMELNKEIVLGELPDSLKELKNVLKDYDEES